MKTTKWAFLLMSLCAAPAALADEGDGETREDPWEYDKEKGEKREEAEREEKASERTFGNSGEFVISAERLLGFAVTSSKITQAGTDSKDSVTRLNLLTNANQDALGYSAPRLAFDYFVTDAISIGLAVGFSSTSADDVKNQYFAVSPRFGYAFMFSETFGIWPRVGATYLDQNLEAPIHGEFAGGKIGVLAISAELPLVIVPVEHVALSIGPTFDGGVFGKINPDGPQDQTDFAMDEFGAAASLSAFF